MTPSVVGMDTNTAQSTLAVANVFVFTDDHEASLGFYRDTLGFAVGTDVTNGGFRWCTLTTPTQPGLEIVLQSPGIYPGTSDADKAALADLLAKGHLSALIFGTDDVDGIYETVKASGAEVVQEPADQFYGVRDCAFRDPAGNMVRFKTDLPQGADTTGWVDNTVTA